MTTFYMSNKLKNKQAHSSNGNGILGGLIGRGLGFLGEKVFGKTKGIDGQQLGDTLGSKIIPFKKGGVMLLSNNRMIAVPAKRKATRQKRKTKAKK